MAGSENGEAARAGAEVEHALNLRRLVYERRGAILEAAEMGVENFADEGTWHDHAFVDIEGQAAHVDLVDEIGGRLPRLHAALDQLKDLFRLRRGHPRGCKRC